MIPARFALAHLADSRDDFYARRQPLIRDELARLDWLRGAGDLCESEILRSADQVHAYSSDARRFGAESLVVHLAIWADPILTLKLWNELNLPILLLGNSRPETSSLVGLLGAGGALDQVGIKHTRVFDLSLESARKAVIAFTRAAAARARLHGQTLGLFGGRSLGIFTATADAAQWQKLFGVDIEYFDQCEIVQAAGRVSDELVREHIDWLTRRISRIQYGGSFDPSGLDRQVRSYLATKQLVQDHRLDFVGVKCQTELSDGYVTQCVAHMLLNGPIDAAGDKAPTVHACESDADGALTMQILHLLSGGQPTALLDIRWFDHVQGAWTLANCGALACSFFATDADHSGLSALEIVPHVFGLGGGGALPGVVAPQTVTLARLCRKNGEYWMAIVEGRTESRSREELAHTTGVFPQAFVKTSAGDDFLQVYGSNHIHMIAGDWTQELIAFAQLVGIRYQIWR